MEAVEEPPIVNDACDDKKVNNVGDAANAEAENSEQPDICQKSNGVAEANETEQVDASIGEIDIPEEVHPTDVITEEEKESAGVTIEYETSIPKLETEHVAEEEITEIVSDKKDVESTEIPEQNEPEKTEATTETQIIESVVEVDGIVDTSGENVTFETEILIETNIDDKLKCDEPAHSNTILSELGQNIELSEVLRSSDVTDNVENNNCDLNQEVFNKEELLDILEGNDMEQSRKAISENFPSQCKSLEAQLAMQQLTRLKKSKRARNSNRTPDKRNSNKSSETPKEESVRKKRKTEQSSSQQQLATCEAQTDEAPQKDDPPKKVDLPIKNDAPKKDSPENEEDSRQESIVNDLVKDWEDDDPADGEQTNNLLVERVDTSKKAKELENTQDVAAGDPTGSKRSNADTSPSEDQTPVANTSGSEGQPQRRLGRVIKKKVIFDPDNPDTFVSKVIKKENQSDKEVIIPKKVKPDSTSLRSKSKSPVSKLQWKKPQPKNSKQNKRLTEIDRLLMDEGAVNMICQLTPEAPKGNKNMKSKAEFIKKIQSSTPDTKEMKFRERKKEMKTEEGEARRISSGKDRLSVTGSVKSPYVGEDYEAHSADDSIIYRRHSSSSYSSSCMSPRRLSDVEGAIQNAAMPHSEPSDGNSQLQIKAGSVVGTEAFMSENASTPTSSIINKVDCLSIKEKLNSKLSLALNKRKSDSNKTDKPSKVKKVSENDEIQMYSIHEATHNFVKLSIAYKVAEIRIQSTGSTYNVEVIRNLEAALKEIETFIDVSVTLITADSGVLCSSLDLKAILKTKNALEIAESARSLLCTLQSHNKLVCTAVDSKCQGFWLSLVALSDVVLASELASFELCACGDKRPMEPGAAVLIATGLPQPLLNDLLLFGRQISATEAQRGGLASRVLWPEGFLAQALAIVKDIAHQPTQNLLLKKQLLSLKKPGSEAFLSSLLKERDLLVKYWTSAEVKELIRSNSDTA